MTDGYREEVLTLLPLTLIIILGLIPSRRQPESYFLAKQRWRYRHVIIVALIIAAGQWVPPPGAAAASGMWLGALRYGFIGFITIASVLSVARLNHRRAWRALGLNPTTALYNVLWSLRIAFAIASVLAIIAVLGRAGSITRVESTVNAAGAAFGDWLVAILVTTIVVPLAEELFFRGLAYGSRLRTATPQVGTDRCHDRNCSALGQ